jgi:hypothetical protein
MQGFLPWFSPITATGLGMGQVMEARVPETGQAMDQAPVPITATGLGTGRGMEAQVLETDPGMAHLPGRGTVQDNKQQATLFFSVTLGSPISGDLHIKILGLQAKSGLPI